MMFEGSNEPWRLIINNDGTPKADDFNASSYEMTPDLVEQMYGMIWWLANKVGGNRETALAAIRNARENAQTGVDIGTGRWIPGPVKPLDATLLYPTGEPVKPCEAPASPECPIYKKVRASPHSNFYMITCDEGWRTLIVCTDLYENVADWLVGVLGRIPYAHKVDR
jgi:hypothetical protein